MQREGRQGPRGAGGVVLPTTPGMTGAKAGSMERHVRYRTGEERARIRKETKRHGRRGLFDIPRSKGPGRPFEQLG